MTILAKPRIVIQAGLALMLSAPLSLAHAQGPASGLRPSEPAAIVAAARSCNAALTPERLDEARLTADGWSGGEVRSNGGAVDTPLRMFSRDNILIIATPGSPSCMVMARLRSLRHYSRLVEALTAAFGTPAQAQDNGQNMWLLEGDRALRVDPTGTRDRPSARIAVVHVGSDAGGDAK